MKKKNKEINEVAMQIKNVGPTPPFFSCTKRHTPTVISHITHNPLGKTLHHHQQQTPINPAPNPRRPSRNEKITGADQHPTGVAGWNPLL